MPTSCRKCHGCETNLSGFNSHGFCCTNCGRWFCESCASCTESRAVNIDTEEKEDCKKLCRACDVNVYKGSDLGRKCYDSSSLANDSAKGDNLLASSLETGDCNNTASIRGSLSRYEEEEARNYGEQFLFPSDSLDIESDRVSGRDELFGVGSSPQDSPCRNSFSPIGHSVQLAREERPNVDSFDQEHMAYLRKSDQEGDLYPESHEALQSQEDKSQQQPLDFENNDRIWYPPPPKDGVESSDFLYDEEDSDIEHPASEFSSHNPAREEPLRTVVNDQFRAIVVELLRGYNTDWLDIVTTLAREAANFIKPDTTSIGGSMDPGHYVKIKCVASGNPNQSILIKGIVCSKKIDHNRTFSKFENPKFLLLAESFEHQRVASQLASFEKLLQQEKDYLTIIMAKIESLLPNLLLVEKSLSSYARQYLREKGIPLVLDMKRPLLGRIARCTGALFCLWGDSISTAQVGHCKLFQTEEVMEQLEAGSHPKRKASRTLMFFKGCPRRLGCTVLLRGSCREELKKVKSVVQYAVFAAYHLSLETSFLADEGASLPVIPSSSGLISCGLNAEDFGALNEDLPNKLATRSHSSNQLKGLQESVPSSREVPESQTQLVETHDLAQHERFDEDVSSEYFSVANSCQSILVFFSSRCVSEKQICVPSRPLQIKFYGTLDKPLGTYLKNEIFTQPSRCEFCKQLVDAHLRCYTHQNGNLATNVKLLSSMKLHGEDDGIIWMWHRCLRCPHVDGVPPASPRVVMSDAASRLSFGKFLELSFSNRETMNRVASCGHSLQRDCLRFFGSGSMVVYFRYSPIDILTVYLPPPVLEFNSYRQLEWICKEAEELNVKMGTLHEEISVMLNSLEAKSNLLDPQQYEVKDLMSQIMDLKDQLRKEKDEYNDALQPFFVEDLQSSKRCLDILELNRLRCALLIGSHAWDNQLFLLKSRLENEAALKIPDDEASRNPELQHSPKIDLRPQEGLHKREENVHSNPEAIPDNKDLEKSETISETGSFSSLSSPLLRPLRIHSLDSASRARERTQKDLSRLGSFHVSNVMENYAQMLPLEVHKLNLVVGSTPRCISSASHMAGEAQMLLPQLELIDIVIPVYEDDPGSAVSYALSSKEYKDWVASRSNSVGSVDGSKDDKDSPNFTISFNDNLSAAGCKMKFLVTCYHATQFDTLRKKCCPSEVDFVRSLSRCKRWDAQGGKSKVYFAKSLDERFIIKEVIKKELESFGKFAFEYFKYLAELFSTAKPTCIAKILGIYQVSVKNLKGGKERKKDFVVMENLFYNRTISRIYDLKGSKRSRYNTDTSGANNVLLDENLLVTEPIFVGSKAKRSLERAVWNDTTFLSSVGVMDYSLLVGLDEERKELVLGIIDFLRPYTWEKRVETVIKTSGILGGPKNVPPTVISPEKYKKRFSEAMPSYFLTVPDPLMS